MTGASIRIRAALCAIVRARVCPACSGRPRRLPLCLHLLHAAVLCLGLVVAGGQAAFAQPAAPLASTPTPTSVPVIRTTLVPANGAVVGQRLGLMVDVLFPGAMPRPPQVSVPDVPGAQVMRFETQGTTMSDTIGGQTYNGQRFEFSVYPRRGGRLALAPANVRLLDSGGAITGTLQGTAVTTDITVPPGIDAGGPVIATTRLTLDETWSPDPAGPFKTGDAITRTIVRTAEDMPALAMRDLVFPAPTGVRIYADPPVSDDRTARGALTGKRTDRVTYVFEAGGQFELPAVVQPWWNLRDGEARNTTGAGVSITVKAAPVPAAPASAMGAIIRHPLEWIAIAIAAVGLVLAGLWLHPVRRLATAWHSRHVRRLQSEPHAFHALIRACGGSDPRPVYRSLAAWRRLVAPATCSASAGIAADLERAVFASDAASRWDKARAGELAQNLRRLRDRQGQEPALPTGPLPPLNP